LGPDVADVGYGLCGVHRWVVWAAGYVPVD
jgi:hypothetical protein